MQSDQTYSGWYSRLFKIPPLSFDASKWNNTSTLGLKLQDFECGAGVDVVACVQARFCANTGSNNDLGGDESFSITLPTLHIHECMKVSYYGHNQHQKSINSISWLKLTYFNVILSPPCEEVHHHLPMKVVVMMD